MAPPEHPATNFGIQSSIYDVIGYHQAPPPKVVEEQPAHTGPNGIPLRGEALGQCERQLLMLMLMLKLASH
jgi:hypothetical protein